MKATFQQQRQQQLQARCYCPCWQQHARLTPQGVLPSWCKSCVLVLVYPTRKPKLHGVDRMAVKLAWSETCQKCRIWHRSRRIDLDDESLLYTLHFISLNLAPHALASVSYGPKYETPPLPWSYHEPCMILWLLHIRKPFDIPGKPKVNLGRLGHHCRIAAVKLAYLTSTFSTKAVRLALITCINCLDFCTWKFSCLLSSRVLGPLRLWTLDPGT